MARHLSKRTCVSKESVAGLQCSPHGATTSTSARLHIVAALGYLSSLLLPHSVAPLPARSPVRPIRDPQPMAPPSWLPSPCYRCARLRSPISLSLPLEWTAFSYTVDGTCARLGSCYRWQRPPVAAVRVTLARACTTSSMATHYHLALPRQPHPSSMALRHHHFRGCHRCQSRGWWIWARNTGSTESDNPYHQIRAATTVLRYQNKFHA